MVILLYTKWTEQPDMPDPDALWKDVQRLDDLYEELLWHPDDELQFTHDGQRIIITNKTLEEKQNEWESRKTEWTCSNDWFRCSCWCIPDHWTSHPRCMVSDMLLIAASMVGGFIFAALLTDGNTDDDDGPDGGLMQPVYAPTPWQGSFFILI